MCQKFAKRFLSLPFHCPIANIAKTCKDFCCLFVSHFVLFRSIYIQIYMSVHTYRWIPLAHAPKQENASSKCSLYSYPTLWSTHEAYNWYFECPWIAPVWNLCQELQSCKDQIKHLKDTLQQRSGSVEVQKMQKELEDLTQEHQQTKAMLVESEKRKSDIQSEIARVQSAKTSLEDELSKQQEETAGLKAKLEAKADHSMKTSQDWMFEHVTAVFFSEMRYLQLALISRCVKSLPSVFFHFPFTAVFF